MYQDFTYEAVLAASLRGQWQLDDVLGPDDELDFERNFLPESLARTAAAPGLTSEESRTLNQISAHQYICQFEVVEEFIVPFLAGHMQTTGGNDVWQDRALSNFVDEEKKHLHLFKRFRAAFNRGAGIECEMLDSSQVPARILRQDPLAVGLLILMFEWATQAHYLGSVRDDLNIELLFKRLLKNHWVEEAQHAKLDTLVVDAIAQGQSAAQTDRAIHQFFAMVAQIDANLKIQARLNIRTLERAANRPLTDCEALVQQQHLAGRWMYLGCGLAHPRFQASLRAISPTAAARIAQTVAVMAKQSGQPLAQHQIAAQSA